MILIKSIETPKESGFYFSTREETFVHKEKLFKISNFDDYDFLPSTKHMIIKNQDKMTGCFRLIFENHPICKNLKIKIPEPAFEISRLIITESNIITHLELMRILYKIAFNQHIKFLVGEILDKDFCNSIRRLFSKSVIYYGSVKINDHGISEDKFCYPIMINIKALSEDRIYKKIITK